MPTPKTLEGHPVLTPVFIADGAKALIAFMKDVFGAEEKAIYPGEGDKIAHAEVSIGGSMVMLCDPFDGFPVQTARIMLYVNDLDDVYKKGVAHGATGLGEPKDETEYGMRVARLQDRWGNYWTLAQVL